ncbi:Predicted membrane protein [Weissella viridescens]|uniref:Predicted membrane protein n=1 Tax=Weissella viridescens TaxID=1629 RepID=A0A380P2R7_WEIVI|nr:Predicted membrane protein [Weissella viridescens]
MEKKNGLSTRSVVAVGIGTAVFIILFKFLAIPTGIANTQINVAQAWLSLIAAILDRSLVDWLLLLVML